MNGVSPTLSSVASGTRDNNFNLLRVLAAYAVLVSHSYFLTTDSVAAQPLFAQTGMTLGDMAVHCFFVMSGFLVTNSLLQRENLASYAVARLLRVLPGLLVMLLLTVFVLGPWLSSMPAGDYFRATETWQYLLKNITLFAGVAWVLPGVFEGNTHPETVNGSLWTLTSEVRLYAAIALIWSVARALSSSRRKQWFKGFVLAGVMLTGLHTLLWNFDYVSESQSARLGFMFLSGAAYQLFAHRVRLSKWIVMALAAALALAWIEPLIFRTVYLVALPYLLLFVAYIPAGIIRRYNTLGDYSYGIYIYSFAVQQTLLALLPDLSVAGLTILATVVSMMLAALSWHLIEHPALRYKY